MVVEMKVLSLIEKRVGFRLQGSFLLALFIFLFSFPLVGSAATGVVQSISLGETGSYREDGILSSANGEVLDLYLDKPGTTWIRPFAFPRKALFSNRYSVSLEILSLKGAWGGVGLGKAGTGVQVLVSQDGGFSLRSWRGKEYREVKRALAGSPLSFPGKLEMVYDTEKAEVLINWNGQALLHGQKVGEIGFPDFVTFDRAEVVVFSPYGMILSCVSLRNLTFELR
jgi:hypothetical protein